MKTVSFSGIITLFTLASLQFAIADHSESRTATERTASNRPIANAPKVCSKEYASEIIASKYFGPNSKHGINRMTPQEKEVNGKSVPTVLIGFNDEQAFKTFLTTIKKDKDFSKVGSDVYFSARLPLPSSGRCNGTLIEFVVSEQAKQLPKEEGTLNLPTPRDPNACKWDRIRDELTERYITGKNYGISGTGKGTYDYYGYVQDSIRIYFKDKASLAAFKKVMEQNPKDFAGGIHKPHSAYSAHIKEWKGNKWVQSEVWICSPVFLELVAGDSEVVFQ